MLISLLPIVSTADGGGAEGGMDKRANSNGGHEKKKDVYREFVF